ncbi:Remorin family protein [Quillaja saponaria]|uniref:Remorin family protein n=1 Tax=Quillaja saponaria TaxID=32244 RepID=A0AAD7LE18_QUISA|nr:Remorin family protein [Quillaja saponaria]
MENKQRRVSFSEPQPEKQEESSGARERRIQPRHQQPESLREDYKTLDWFQRQFEYQMNKDHATGDEDYATAVAAAAFAVHSLEEAELRNMRKMGEGPKSSRTKSMSTKDENTTRRPSFGEASMKNSMRQDLKILESAFPARDPTGLSSVRPIAPTDGNQRQMRSSTPSKNVKSRADAWEIAKIEKIKKRYEKMKSKILAWESEKKTEAKLKMERKKSELEQKRAINLQHYKGKLARIDVIVEGARTQAEEKRRKEEVEARETANRIRRTGRTPVTCFCFKCQ